jgi:hypothetical protein
MTLRFIYFKKSEAKPAPRLAESDFEGSIRSRSALVAHAPCVAGRFAPRVLQSFFKIDRTGLCFGRRLGLKPKFHTRAI